MAYDEERAARSRALPGAAELEEKPMFGGLAFLVKGNMAIAASGQGGLLVRVDPDDGDRLLETTPAEPFVMRGRAMSGWLRVASEDAAADEELQTWFDAGVTYARSLPPKR